MSVKLAAVGPPLVLAASLGIAGPGVVWLHVLGLASFSLGLSGLADWSAARETTDTHGARWPIRGPGAVGITLGALFAILAGFIGLMSLVPQALCPPISAERTVCGPTVVTDATPMAMIPVVVAGASLALVCIGFGAVVKAKDAWARLLIVSGLVGLGSLFAGTPSALGLALLGVLWAPVALVVARHGGALR